MRVLMRATSASTTSVAIERRATTVGVTLDADLAARNVRTSSSTISRTCSTSAASSACSARSPSTTRSMTVTPSTRVADGSTSRGRARSTKVSGRPAEAAAAMRWRSKTTPEAPVQVMTTSVAASSASRSSHTTARTPKVATSSCARWTVRLATAMRSGSTPRSTSVRTARLAIVPAPATRKRVVEAAAIGPAASSAGRDDGRSEAVDAGLGVAPLADAERLLEQGVERRADGGLGLCAVQGVADLPEDLALAEDHRVEARGDGEHVRHSGIVVVHVDVLGELGQVEIGVLGEQARDLLDSTVEPLGLDVDLDPVAGGDDRGLGDRRRLERAVRQLDRRVGVERGALEQLDGGGLVRHARR